MKKSMKCFFKKRGGVSSQVCLCITLSSVGGLLRLCRDDLTLCTEEEKVRLAVTKSIRCEVLISLS